MHVEKVVISKTTLENLLKKIDNPIIPVGTTSMRTIESIYWMGVKIKSGNNIFKVEQWDPYLSSDNNISPKESIELLLNYMDHQNISEIKGETKLMIAPGYKFKFAQGLITNFHQPKSTLLLLVSALIGDRWKDAYKYAVNNNFRFLSYGDSCLFLPE
jgi:S-adenosylmethionine:tRNA ribosyltransferase-isomerase